MRLLLVRHGKSAGNEAGVVEGHLPGRLTDAAVEESRVLAEHLKDFGVDHIYSSDLKRAADTAREIASYHEGTLLEFTDVLRTRNYGVFQGKPVSECWPPGTMFWERTAPGGESLDDVRWRIKGFLGELREKHREDTVIVVSHKCVLMIMLSLLHGIDYEAAFGQVPGNASYIVVGVDA
jgi:broad specificity phosphatase PhoE